VSAKILLLLQNFRVDFVLCARAPVCFFLILLFSFFFSVRAQEVQVMFAAIAQLLLMPLQLSLKIAELIIVCAKVLLFRLLPTRRPNIHIKLYAVAEFW
jgi:hypothetical protein